MTQLNARVDQLFARIFSTGTAAWYLTDRLGSVRDIIDNTGAVIDHLNYDGFGNVTSETQPWNGDRFKWTGRELDSGALPSVAQHLQAMKYRELRRPRDPGQSS